MITKDIIKAFVKGEKKGFDVIYEAYSSGMFMICLRYTRCEDDAKDVLQDTFIKVYNKREMYDPGLPIGPWIKTITIRTALNYIKENYKIKLTDDENFFDESVVYDLEEQHHNDLKARLLAILNKLPDGYRTIFNLYTVDNLTHKEIAGYLNISEGTSKSQYSKAKKMIKSLLQEEKIAS